MKLTPIDGTYDTACMEAFKNSPNTAISWILSASLAYYCRHTSILSDSLYDNLCAYVLDNYDTIEHQHKSLITKDMLRAGTAYNLKIEDYPMIVRVSTEDFIQKILEEDNNVQTA